LFESSKFYFTMKPFVFPGIISQDILNVNTCQIPYMRTEEFSTLVKNCEHMLLELFKCSAGRAIFGTSSGTAAMDAVVSNYVSTKKSPMVIAGGSFGYRWSEICTYYNISHSLFEVPFARDIDFIALEEYIDAEQPDVILCQHHETSSGQLHNLSRISELCKVRGIRLVVDAISSFLSDDFDFDALDVSIAITSSQKGLNIAPGLSFIILSDQALKEPWNRNNYYFDFKTNLDNLKRGQTPYSPATTLFMQLHARLKLLISEGLENHKTKVTNNAEAFRIKCREYNWQMPAQTPSNCITGFYINTDTKKLVQVLNEQGVYIMPGGSLGFLRVSHTGDNLNISDYSELADLIFMTLNNLK